MEKKQVETRPYEKPSVASWSEAELSASIEAHGASLPGSPP
jgi:hypothetical protein